MDYRKELKNIDKEKYQRPIYFQDDSTARRAKLAYQARPVSLLCILSKVFEKVMCSRLFHFLESFKILIENQFGFRKQHSSFMAFIVIIDKLIKSIDKGEHVIGVFLDFSKAFDIVDHDILLSKLYHYGIRGVALKWFESYLSGRSPAIRSLK